MNKTDLQKWIEYHQWRVDKICQNLQQVDSLSFLQPIKGSFSSLSHLVGHAVSAEHIWLVRMNNQADKFPKYEYFENIHIAKTTWQQVTQRFIQKLQNLNDEELSGTFSYYTNSGKLITNAYQDVLLHIFDHSTYHIGQIAWIIRSFGITPISTNYIFYLREKQN
ncbi:MAG: DinB family protein [Bacteroidia bacterium]|nr:DinB family protein [Bacteroidia bacterium]MDW8346290.1 DinB family protein [Bacteroidia bacterium]